MLGWMHFQSTRRSGESFCPEGLNGSITASICKVEFPLFRMIALKSIKVNEASSRRKKQNRHTIGQYYEEAF